MCNISIMYIISRFSTECMYTVSQACDYCLRQKRAEYCTYILLIHKILYKVGLTLIYVMEWIFLQINIYTYDLISIYFI